MAAEVPIRPVTRSPVLRGRGGGACGGVRRVEVVVVVVVVVFCDENHPDRVDVVVRLVVVTLPAESAGPLLLAVSDVVRSWRDGAWASPLAKKEVVFFVAWDKELLACTDAAEMDFPAFRKVDRKLAAYDDEDWVDGAGVDDVVDASEG